MFTADENKLIKAGFTGLKEKIAEYQKSSLERVTSGNKIPKAETIKLSTNDFDFQNGIATRIKQIQEIFKKDNSAVLYSNISASKDAFLKIKQFEKQKAKLEKQRKTLEIIYNDGEDLKELATKEEFREFILKDSLKSINKAIKNNLDKVELFNIFNLSLIIELDKSNYKNVLENISKHYIEDENYEMCSSINKLIKKIKWKKY